jgi:hypothetical protein
MPAVGDSSFASVPEVVAAELEVAVVAAGLIAADAATAGAVTPAADGTIDV